MDDCFSLGFSSSSNQFDPCVPIVGNGCGCGCDVAFREDGEHLDGFRPLELGSVKAHWSLRERDDSGRYDRQGMISWDLLGGYDTSS